MKPRQLESLPLFADFDAAELAQVAEAMDEREVADGALLLGEGSRPDGLFVVLDGRVRLSQRAADGSERLLKTLGVGEAVGLIALVEHTRRNASARSQGRGRVAFLPRAVFAELYGADSALALKFQRLIARQLADDARALNQALFDAYAARLAGAD